MLLVRNIRLPLTLHDPDAEAAAKALRILHLRRSQISHCGVARLSVDARRGKPVLVYTIAVTLHDERQEAALADTPGVSFAAAPQYRFATGSAPLMHRPVVVGLGPAGLFAALLLSSGVSALELPGGLDEAVPRELIESAEAGDDLIMHGGQYLFSHFRTALQSAAAKSLRGAMALMLLSLLCGLVEGTAESAGEQPARYAGYLGVLGAAAIASQDLSALIGVGVQTMDELAAMAKLLIPTVAAAMAGGGCVGSASVWQVGALMLSDLFLSLMRNVLVPLLYCMIAASAAGALLEQSRLSLLSKGIGRLLSWGLSAVLIVFTAFLSLTNLLAGSADRLAVRVGKTVISGAVPVVGGILSDATEAVAAAALTLRGTLGVLGVFSVLALCLAPLLHLAVQYLFYQLAAFFSAVTGADPLCKFLEQLSSAFSLMLAMTAGGAFLLLVSFLIAMMMVVTV